MIFSCSSYVQEMNFLEGGDSWDLAVSIPARAEKTPSALQEASRFGHQVGAQAAPTLGAGA
jgi:hypothetical protein